MMLYAVTIFDSIHQYCSVIYGKLLLLVRKETSETKTNTVFPN